MGFSNPSIGVLYSSFFLFFFYEFCKLQSIYVRFWLVHTNFWPHIKNGDIPVSSLVAPGYGQCSRFNCFILSVVQKLAPSFVLCFIICGCSSYNIILIGALGALFGGLNGINQTQIRLILAYSSVGHLGLILCSIFISFFVFVYYYLIYIFIRSGLILLLNISPFKVSNLLYSIFWQGLILFRFSYGLPNKSFLLSKNFFQYFYTIFFKRLYIKNVTIFTPFRL